MADTMKALVGSEAGGYRLAQDLERPVPGAGTLVCRVHSVALSPYDAKIVDYANTPGAVGGCDFAGTVVAVGEGVSRFKQGDRILAVTFGLNATDKTAGAFAEYAIAIADLSCPVPDGLSLEQASSMGLGIATAGLALFETPGLQLAMSRPADTAETTEETGPFVLVSGGATGTGTMAIQLLNNAGYTPIATCSPSNNALCKAYGAVACFDYNAPTCGDDIRDYTSGSLAFVLDCVTDAPTMRMCYRAIGSSGGHYVALEPISTTVKYTRRDVRSAWIMAPSIVGNPVEIPGAYGRPSMPQHRQFGARLFELAGKLIEAGKITNHPLDVRVGGLASIPTYLNDLRVGNVRAKRQVVPLAV